jgi:hypothetical protein
MDTPKHSELSKGTPGLVFNELYTRDIPGCIRLFTGLFDFSVVRDEGEFVELRSRTTVLLLNEGKDLEPSHPSFGKITGHDHGQCVEIVFVVQDLKDVHNRASQLPDCLVTPIVLQEWDLRDFRITTKEGFYLRITEAFP